MSVNPTTDLSICLYDYLCQNIVGSEDHIKLIRLVNASTDLIYSSNSITCITSGSFGEGLELPGSDLDIMLVRHDLEVTEQTKLHDYRPSKIYFFPYTEDVKPGFAFLRLMKENIENNILMCRWDEERLFLSSVLFKQFHRSEGLSVVHGPCVSDEEGKFDLAICLHIKSWITTASKWFTRSNNSWQNSAVKQKVIDHGVLFVPIGKNGYVNEELKWRISFSVGEKFLIYTFSHTQLLCSALMKVMMTDVISQSPGCNDLLCSYFIKTILFWVSEELPTSVWKQDNLIPCFMQCFKRLIYCVEYSVCPHYFIAENNLFEDKIVGNGRTKLLQILYILNDYGWQCIFLSVQISNMALLTRVQFKSDIFVNNIEKIIKSKALVPFKNIKIIENIRHFKIILSSQSKTLRPILLHSLTWLCLNTVQTMQPSSSYGNSYKYKQYKKCLCYLLQSTHYDAVTGWLMLASLFYKEKKYNKTLYILSYSLTKCTTENPFTQTNLSHVQRELFRSQAFRNLGMIQSLRIILVSSVFFLEESSLIPDAIKMINYNLPYILPPVVYLHFLTLLCHYQQHNVRSYQESLGDLRLTIEEDYFIADCFDKAITCEYLGVAFQIIGDRESAREALVRSIKLNPKQLMNRSFKRLAMMDFV